MAVFEEFQVPFYVNTDLDKFGMTIDVDAISFRLLNFETVFENEGFFNLSGFRHKKYTGM